MDSYMKRLEVEKDEEWTKWMNEIPALKFKDDWEVRIVPPFGGAMVRFWIDKGENHVSVYLDCHERLGCGGGPYWELYPYEGDTFRCGMEETDKLLDAISEVLDLTPQQSIN